MLITNVHEYVRKKINVQACWDTIFNTTELYKFQLHAAQH